MSTYSTRVNGWIRCDHCAGGAFDRNRILVLAWAAVLTVVWCGTSDAMAESSATETTDANRSAEVAAGEETGNAIRNEADTGSETRQPRNVTRRADEQQAGGSVDRALRKLATIPRPNITRITPEPDRTNVKDPSIANADRLEYYLPSGTRVIVINPDPRHPQLSSNLGKVPDHPAGRVGEPNRLGMAHADAIRNSVSSIPSIGDDILGADPDWQGGTVRGGITNRNDPRLRSANSFTRGVPSYTPYRSDDYYDERYVDGHSRLHTQSRVLTDEEFRRFGFVGERHPELFRRAYGRTDRLLGNAEKFRDRGLRHMSQGNYRQAADAFKLAAETNQHDPAARLYATHAYFANGRYRDAVKFLRRAFELQPRVAYLNFDLRDDYGRKSDFDRHLKALERASRQSPRNIDRLVLHGYVLSFSNQRDLAWQPLIQAYKINPDDALVRRLMETAQPPDVELEKAGIELD